MARVQGGQKKQAGLMVKLVYRLGPRMMRKLTGRQPSIGNGLEPMEIWAHKPKLMMAMGKFNGAVRKPGALEARTVGLADAASCRWEPPRVGERMYLLELSERLAQGHAREMGMAALKSRRVRRRTRGGAWRARWVVLR
jgi:hypothetical protein